YFQFRTAIFTAMEKNEYRVLGVMSGTSLDGIDVAILEFHKEDRWNYSVKDAETFPYPRTWQARLAEAVSYDQAQLEKLNSEYTEYLAEVILDFKRKHQLGELDAVCSHG